MNAVGARTLEYLRGERDLFEKRKLLAELKKRVEASNLSYWMNGVNKRRVEGFWHVVSLLQENSRMTLMEMSRKLKIPVSTLFETVKEVEKSFQFTIVLKDDVKDILPGDSVSLEFTEGAESAGVNNWKQPPRVGHRKEWFLCLKKARFFLDRDQLDCVPSHSRYCLYPPNQSCCSNKNDKPPNQKYQKVENQPQDKRSIR